MKEQEKVQPGREGATSWGAVLQAVVAVAHRGASSEPELLDAVSEVLRRLQLTGGVSLLTSVGQLEVSTQIVGEAAGGPLEQLTGRQVVGYRFNPQEVDVYDQALGSGEPVFSDDRVGIIRQLTPKPLQSLVPQIVRLVGGNLPTIVAPLVLADQILGTINVSAAWLTPRDVPMMRALADQIAIALGHVRAREEMRAALERERLRNQVAEAITSALELPVVLERIIILATEVVGADAGAISLVEADDNAIGPPHLYALPEALKDSLLPRGRGPAWRPIETRRPILIEEYREEPDALPGWTEAGVSAFLGVPLSVGEEAIGTLSLFMKSPGRSFQPGSVETAQSIANMAAIAVNNARLYAEMRKRAEESQALIQTARSISGLLDIDAVLNLIAEQAKELLKSDGSRIHMIDAEKETLSCLVAIDPLADALLKVELKLGEGLVGHVAETRESMLVNDPLESPHSLHIPDTPEDEPECLALAPLTTRSRTIGVMAVRRLGQERPFSAGDLDVLSAFAAQAAVAIENADLYGQIESQAMRLEHQVEARTRDLAFSEARYRALVETSLAGIFQVDLEGRLVYVNQACADLVERPKEELIGESAVSLWSPEQHTTARQRLEARLRGERPPREVHEVEVRSSSGRTMPALLAVSLITDDDGKIQGATGLVLDISRRKLLEKALRAERDRLNAILTNIADAVMVTDAEGNIEYVNPAWEHLTGYTSPEAIVENPSFLRSGYHPPNIYDQIQATISSGHTWRGELVNKRHDDSTYDAAVSVTPVTDSENNVVNFVSVQHDISPLKEVDRLKSKFVSDVSHELRTPLTNIRLYVDLLSATEDQEKAKRYLQTLVREGERLTHLINDLLSLSHLDTSDTAFDHKPVDLNRVLQALVEDRQTMAADRGILLTIEGDPTLPLLMGDEAMLTQLFTNLLSNAISFTSDGGRITLQTSCEQNEAGEWIRADVTDTGYGIPKEEQPLIFDRFFRGQVSHTLGTPGTGLGLAISREIAARHGGTITVESQPGVGSRFSVWLPVAERT